MYQAIQTKYFGPSDVRGARVKAYADAKSIILSWDHALNAEQNHIAAARALARKLDWKGVWSGGGKKEGGYAFVQASPNDFCI
jgi:hypothetical protein